jgi:hypothetical protein
LPPLYDWYVAANSLTLDLLAWISKTPRTYPETMEAWHTHCPRLPIWEDAIDDGLIQVRNGNVTVTPRGEAMLRQTPAATPQRA